jgi:hypothetical protein
MFDLRQGQEGFFPRLCVETDSGAHPASYTVGSFPGGKALPGREADHSPLSSAEFMTE